MLTTIRNSIRYDPANVGLINDYCTQQRAAYNAAVEHTLAHPNTDRFGMFRKLTRWKEAESAKDEQERRWKAPVSILRPGLTRGHIATAAFLKADASVLKQCIREVDMREQLQAEARDGKKRKVTPPKHGNHPGRDPDPRRLFRSRKRPTTLSIDEANAIKVVSRRKLKVAGVLLTLARPLPPRSDVRALQIIERKSSVRRGRNRPLHDRSYDIRVVVNVDDPEVRSDFENPVGLDIGKVIHLQASDGEAYRMPEESLTHWSDRRDALYKRQQRCQHGSRRWGKLQRQIRHCNRKMGNIRTNAERHIAVALTNRHDAVFVENLPVRNMKRSARGTMENPGRNVAAKSGLNRTLAEMRPGSSIRTIDRRCEKTGTPFAKVDPRYTSQRCYRCGYTDAKNRKKQAEFLCLSCSLEINADLNAARNVLRKGAIIRLCCIIITRQALDTAQATYGRLGVPSLVDCLMITTAQPNAEAGAGDAGASSRLLAGRPESRAMVEQTTAHDAGQLVA